MFKKKPGFAGLFLKESGVNESMTPERVTARDHHFSQFVHHNNAYHNRNDPTKNGGRKLTRAEADHHKKAAEAHRAAASVAAPTVMHNNLHTDSPERHAEIAKRSAEANRMTGHDQKHDYKHTAHKGTPGSGLHGGQRRTSPGYDPMVTHKGNPVYLD